MLFAGDVFIKLPSPAAKSLIERGAHVANSPSTFCAYGLVGVVYLLTLDFPTLSVSDQSRLEKELATLQEQIKRNTLKLHELEGEYCYVVEYSCLICAAGYCIVLYRVRHVCASRPCAGREVSEASPFFLRPMKLSELGVTPRSLSANIDPTE